MIALDFSWGVGIFACAAALVLLVFSLELSRGAEQKTSLDPKFVWVCSVCTYNFVKTREETISVCPRCGSFNKK